MNKGGNDDDKHNMKIIMQLIKPESKDLYHKSLNLSAINDQLIIVEELKMNMLAKSCFAPGLITMIGNLVASASEPDDEYTEQWVKEYQQGIGFEIYRKKIEEVDFRDVLTFKDVAEIAHKFFNCIVFALEIQLKDKKFSEAKPVIKLNPVKF